MSVNYSAIAQKALAGIKKAGKAMSLVRRSGGEYDPAQGKFVTDGGGGNRGDSTYTAYGIYQSRSQSQTSGLGDRWFDGVEVQTGDRFILLAASGLSVIPQPGDLLDGFRIIASLPVAPGGVDLLYKILARL